MGWLLRFFLGLPPDDEGRSEAARLVAELEGTAHEDREWVLPLLIYTRGGRAGPLHLLDRQEFARALRAWLDHKAHEPSKLPDPKSGPGEGARCPLGAECPLSRPAGSTSGGAGPSESSSGHEPPQNEKVSQPTILEALRAGGAAVGQGTNAFLDLVEKTKHCHGEDISALVTTDRFFHDSLGEDGAGAGYDVLLRLLDVLGVLRSEHPVTLFVSPHGNADKVAAFTRRIEATRKGLTVVPHNPVRVHDRFYIIKSNKAVRGRRFSGVFGPSLNGLDGGLYVMGSFEDDALKRVAEALNL